MKTGIWLLFDNLSHLVALTLDVDTLVQIVGIDADTVQVEVLDGSVHILNNGVGDAALYIGKFYECEVSVADPLVVLLGIRPDTNLKIATFMVEVDMSYTPAFSIRNFNRRHLRTDVRKCYSYTFTVACIQPMETRVFRSTC